MYKLVSVVVDSDAYEKTYEFRAIVKHGTKTRYEGVEARNVLLDVLSLNNIFEVKLRGNMLRSDMDVLKDLSKRMISLWTGWRYVSRKGDSRCFKYWAKILYGKFNSAMVRDTSTFC